MVAATPSCATNLSGVALGVLDDVWAVGTKWLGAPTGTVGTIAHYDGKAWSTSVDVPQALNGIWRHAADDLWASGPAESSPWQRQLVESRGEHRFDGAPRHLREAVRTMFGPWESEARSCDGISSWTTAISGTTVDSEAVWVTGPGDAWAVGAHGTILRWNGSTWEASPSGTTTHLTDVWASGPDDAWAVGYAGLALHWNGKDWTETKITPGYLFAVWGTGPKDVWQRGT